MLKKIIIQIVAFLFIFSVAGCSRSSSWQDSSPGPKSSQNIEHIYDYSHDVINHKKFRVAVLADYREYKGKQFPNFEEIGAVNDRVDVLKIVQDANSLDAQKYRDIKTKELQQLFGDNPLALLKNELTHTNDYLVIEYIGGVSQQIPDYFVTLNIHHENLIAKCYLSMIDYRTGEIVASSVSSNESLAVAIKKAVKNLIK